MQDARERSVHRSPVSEESVQSRVQSMHDWQKEAADRLETKRSLLEKEQINVVHRGKKAVRSSAPGPES
jgi:hypothetical protein